MAQKKIANQGFMIYNENLSTLNRLPDDQRGKLISKLGEVSCNLDAQVNIDDLSESAQIVFELLAPKVRLNGKKYIDNCRKNRKNATSGQQKIRAEEQEIFAGLSNSERFETVLSKGECGSIGDDLKLVLVDWMQYKDDRKNIYRSPKSIQALIQKFRDCEQRYGLKTVRALVDDSISHDWANVFWEKAEEMKKKVSKPKQYIPPKLTD